MNLPRSDQLQGQQPLRAVMSVPNKPPVAAWIITKAYSRRARPPIGGAGCASSEGLVTENSEAKPEEPVAGWRVRSRPRIRGTFMPVLKYEGYAPAEYLEVRAK